MEHARERIERPTRLGGYYHQPVTVLVKLDHKFITDFQVAIKA